MNRVENPELKRKILDHLIDQYQLKEKREPNHLSTYIYCRTKAYFEQQPGSIEPTEQEVMLFAIGYGLQDVLTPKSAKAPVYNQGGIIYRPDMVFHPTHTEVENLVELKTTRMSAKKHWEPDHIPVTWLDYMMGGCYLRKTTKYDLIILYLMGGYNPPFPELYCDTFEFTPEEIGENWAKLQQRKEVLDESLAIGVPPEPYKNCYDWECKYCRYKMVCETISTTMY